jgi:ribonuclease P protein component
MVSLCVCVPRAEGRLSVRVVPKAGPASQFEPLSLGRRNRFSRFNKLHTTTEYNAVFEFHCAARGRYFHGLAMPNKYGVGRLGLIVSKRVARTATERNYYKRFMREQFRNQGMELAGLDIVLRLIAKQPFRDPEALRNDLLHLLETLRTCQKVPVGATNESALY